MSTFLFVLALVLAAVAMYYGFIKRYGEPTVPDDGPVVPAPRANRTGKIAATIMILLLGWGAWASGTKAFAPTTPDSDSKVADKGNDDEGSEPTIDPTPEPEPAPAPAPEPEPAQTTCTVKVTWSGGDLTSVKTFPQGDPTCMGLRARYVDGGAELYRATTGEVVARLAQGVNEAGF